MSAPGRHTDVAKAWYGGLAHRRRQPTPWGCTRLFELRHQGAIVCRPRYPDTPRRPFVRTSSATANCQHGSPKLRAGATGPLDVGFRQARAGRAAARARPSRAQAGAASAGLPSRQGALSRSIAQQRTSSFRARATMACFLRALPRLSRW